MPGRSPSAMLCPEVQLSAERLITARRWAALSRYLDGGASPLTTTGPRIRSDHGLLEARIGSSQDRFAAENGRRRS